MRIIEIICYFSSSFDIFYIVVFAVDILWLVAAIETEEEEKKTQENI